MEVDEFLSSVARHRLLHSGSGTQKAAAQSACVAGELCTQHGVFGEGARMCRRHAASTREGSGNTGGV